MSQHMLEAVQAYFDLFNAKDAQGISDLYAEDATVTDPVGTPAKEGKDCLLYTSPSPRDQRGSRMPSSA